MPRFRELVDGVTVRTVTVSREAVDEIGRLAVELLEAGEDCGGVCVACLDTVTVGVEPDASFYLCEACGEHAVMGAEWLVVRLA